MSPPQRIDSWSEQDAQKGQTSHLPPTGTPRRAIRPGEGLPIFPISLSGEQPDYSSLLAGLFRHPAKTIRVWEKFDTQTLTGRS